MICWHAAESLPTENSKSSAKVFSVQIQWAGRSVWYDRRSRTAEAGGSNPPRSTFQAAKRQKLFLIEFYSGLPEKVF